MKKLLLALCTLLAPASLCALPLGNPSEASLHTQGILWQRECSDCWSGCPEMCTLWSFRFGYYGDFVFDRHLQVHHGSNHSTIHSTNIHTNAAYWALNVCNRLDLFGTLGATQINLSTPDSAFGGLNLNRIPTNVYVNLDTETAFSWSLGVRGTLWQCGCLGIGAEAQYFRTNPLLNSFSATATVNTFYFPSNTHFKYEEWQLGLGASYRINIAACSSALLPYLGVKWAGCRTSTGNAFVPTSPSSTIFDLRNNRDWGYAVGLTLLGCNKASITAEGRFGDEKALYINGQVRF